MENFPIYHIDSLFGPSRMARYEGGGRETSCNVSTKIWIDLHDDIEQKIRTSGTYHTESEVKKATSIRFMSLYVKDVQTIREEWSGKEVIPGDDLLVTDRGVMTRVGDEYVSAEHQFITKREEKGLEDRGESRTLRAAIGAMVASPEAEAYFPVHNQGSDGTDQIRHVAHWKRVGNRIKTEMINISGNQQDKTLLEAQRTLEYAIGKDFMHHQDSTRSYIFTRGVQREGIHFSEINHQQKRTSLNLSFDRARDSRATPEVFRETHQKNTLDRALSDTMIYVSNKVVHDTKDAVASLGTFVFREALEQKRRLQTKTQKSDTQAVGTIVDRIQALFFSDAEQNSNKKESKRITTLSMREKPIDIRADIQKHHELMRRGVAALAVISETGIAVHAGPMILASLVEQLPPSVQAVGKSIERHAKKELRKEKKELRKAKREAKKDSVKVQPLRSERVEPFRAAKERKKKKVRVKVSTEVKVGNRKEQRRRVKRSKENGVKKVATAEKLTPIVTKRRERREKRKLQRVVEKSVRRYKKKESRRVQPLIEKKRSIQKKEREAVTGMVFGWMVWMMLNRANFPSVESKIAMVVQERRGAKLIHPSGVQQWVLRSIIWYLTAIREQGMKNYPMKKKRRTLPKQGIIFAFAS